MANTIPTGYRANAGIILHGVFHGANELVPHLYDHNNYVIHYKSLKYLIDLRVQVMKTHQVISFSQEPRLNTYIEVIIDKRKDATNEFEKSLFKLMNNCVFGKCGENVTNYMEMQLATKEKMAVNYFPQIHS